jgi:hypothetical protein
MNLLHAFTLLFVLASMSVTADEHLGNYSVNKNNANSTSNPYGDGLEIYGE